MKFLTTKQLNLARGCLAIGLLAWIAPCLAMAEEGPWRWSNPQPHGNSIRAIAKGDDFSIEVGDNGSIHTSQNMVQWFPRASGVELPLRAAVFFKEQAIVAGDDGTLLYSESEEQFEPGVLDKPASGNFRALAASGQLIVAGGDDGMLYTSTDGRKWRRRTFKYSNHIHALIWTGNYFVAVNALAYVNKRLWTVGDDGGVLLSYNEGVSWLAASAGTDKNLNAVTGTASEVIVAGENVVRKGVLDFFMYWVDLLDNDEGANPSPPPDWTYYCAIELDDKFLLGGRTGMLVDSVRDEEDDEYLYWFTGDDSVRNWLWDINRVGDLMVAVGAHATMLTSRAGD